MTRTRKNWVTIPPRYHSESLIWQLIPNSAQSWGRSSNKDPSHATDFCYGTLHNSSAQLLKLNSLWKMDSTTDTAFGYKTVDPSFHFLQAGFHWPTHYNYITSALIAKVFSCFNIMMHQIKLTVIFILVITAIAPALSLPVKGKDKVKDNASSGSSKFNWHIPSFKLKVPPAWVYFHIAWLMINSSCCIWLIIILDFVTDVCVTESRVFFLNFLGKVPKKPKWVNVHWLILILSTYVTQSYIFLHLFLLLLVAS